MTTKVVVRHFHEGNDANRKVRKGHSYSTVARIIDLDTGKTVQHVTEAVCLEDSMGFSRLASEPVETWAHCSKGGRKLVDNGKEVQFIDIPPDVPSRKQGRVIALGRLQKQFPKECASADWGVFKNLKIV